MEDASSDEVDTEASPEETEVEMLSDEMDMEASPEETEETEETLDASSPVSDSTSEPPLDSEESNGTVETPSPIVFTRSIDPSSLSADVERTQDNPFGDS